MRPVALVASALGAALATAAPYARAEELDPSVVPAPRQEKRLELRAEAGGGYRSFFDLPGYAGEATVGLGSHTSENFAWYFGFTGRFGRLLYLDQQTYRLVYALEPVIGRLRLGVGVAVAWMSVSRATNRSASITKAGLGLSASATFDLVPLGDHALYLAARLDADMVGGGASWGPSGAFGARF